VLDEQMAEDSFSDSIALFQEIGDATPALLWTTDTEGKNYWFNQGWLDFTGELQATAGVSSRYRHVHDEDRDSLIAAFEAAFEQQDSIEFEYRLNAQSGGFRWILERAAPRFGSPSSDGHPTFLGYVGVCVDITRQFDYRQRLADREKVMQQLHKISEQERSFLSCAIHDGLLQDVIGAEMFIQGISDLNAVAQQKRVAQIRNTLHSAISHGRKLISELRPMILDEQGLSGAVEVYAAALENRGTIKIDVECTVDSDISRTFWRGNVFRIIQEALNNVESHSKSATAKVRMSTKDGRLIVLIQDFGHGFDVESCKDSFGMRCMYERAEIYGGSVDIQSSDSGSTVSIDVPIPSIADVGLD